MIPVVLLSPHPYGLVHGDSDVVVPGSALESVLKVGILSVDPEEILPVEYVADDSTPVVEALVPYVWDDSEERLVSEDLA